MSDKPQQVSTKTNELYIYNNNNNHISRTNDILHKMCEQLHVSNAKIAQFHYHFHMAFRG